MAYSQTLELVSGDSLPLLTVTLQDSNEAAPGATLDENDQSTWAPIDLTDADILLKVRVVSSTTILASIVGSIIDAAAGKVAFIFDEDTFEAAGVYEAEVEITFSGGGVQTVQDLIKFKVRAGF